jgi:hypothetical protein
MKLFTTYLVITVALVAAGIAQAGNPTPAQLRAMEVRGQAMNHLCGDSTLRADAYRALCGSAGASTQPTAAELNALEIRGQALNELCHGSKFASAEGFAAVCGGAATQSVRLVSSTGFHWGDFGIGVVAAFGAVLLAGGIAAGVHYGRRHSVRPRPVS